jgi:glycosyltransferase involved in cell wall biosynthesis
MAPTHSQAPAQGPVVCHITTVHDALDVRIHLKECRALAAAGYRTVLIGPHNHSEHVGGVEVRAIPRRSVRLARIVLGQVDVVRELAGLRPSPVLVHVHDPELLPLAWLLRILGHQVIFDVHEDVPVQILVKDHIPRPLRTLTALAYRSFERVLIRRLATVHVTETIACRYHRPREVVRNFPLLSTIAAADGRRLQPMTRPRLIYVGSVSRLRGLLTMVRVVAALRRRGKETELRVVGRLDDARLRRELTEVIERYRLRGSVTLLGQLPHASAQAEIAEATLGLCLLHDTPGYRNSIPTKIFEYMGAGIPVVASDFPQWREFVIDTGAGIMVDVGDIEGIAASIDALLDDPARRDQMGRRGTAAVRHHFNWEAEGKKLVGFYREILASPDGQSAGASC